MNGWQTYGKWNYAPSGGVALRWSPSEARHAHRQLLRRHRHARASRTASAFHHDDSILVRYYDDPKASFVSKGAVSLNTHVGFETGRATSLPGPDKAHVFGVSLVHRAVVLCAITSRSRSAERCSRTRRAT